MDLLRKRRDAIKTDVSQNRQGCAAGQAPSPSPERLERITEFFNNEIATGKLSRMVEAAKWF